MAACLLVRVVPDIRPFLYLFGIRPDIRFHLQDIWPNIRLDGYRIFGSIMHKIVDIVSNDYQFFLKKSWRKIKIKKIRFFFYIK